ncbi:hypothetical protein F2P81_002073 [Scophthalmus maximus]|uniref:Uncharacterized protein n=1 Tax=Scophthalmus maximus TaxID=52904 RepID=A0A6A4TQN6_SCOMX|nr:hypothetical protein F2P81_002073 [Scophthalmus maximus]
MSAEGRRGRSEDGRRQRELLCPTPNRHFSHSSQLLSARPYQRKTSRDLLYQGVLNSVRTPVSHTVDVACSVSSTVEPQWSRCVTGQGSFPPTSVLALSSPLPFNS